MGPRPWKPLDELDGALERGQLDFATTLAHEVAEERGRPVDLLTALRFLPLVATEQPQAFDLWAIRWLRRWLRESGQASIERAAELAASLADLPAEPHSAFAAVAQLC